MLDSIDRAGECVYETSYDVFIEALEILIRLDAVGAQKRGTALYIRPFIFANENYLAARVSDLCLPHNYVSVGAYYGEGFNPVSLLPLLTLFAQYQVELGRLKLRVIMQPVFYPPNRRNKTVLLRYSGWMPLIISTLKRLVL